MRNTLTTLLFFVNIGLVSPQIVLNIEGTDLVFDETGNSNGVNIPRSEPTILTYRNNSITAVNSGGYMLQAGDEGPRPSNNNLDGEVIIGNRFVWNGTEQTSWTHALFTGYNLGVIIKYNYLQSTPNGIQRKSNGMYETSGVVAYNILNNPKLGVAVKGINGIKIYNNTFYSERTPIQTNRGLVDICNNTDGELNSIASGTKIYNNIFYTRNKVFNIRILEPDCLKDFESDYNVFWCEAGDPIFEVNNETKNFTQWQALGYDLHSIVINPEFTDLTNFVPKVRLDYGMDLGPDLINGLAIDGFWGKLDPRVVSQNGTWQVGARIYEEEEEVEIPDNKLRIYPNPAEDFLIIEMNDPDSVYQYMKIYDPKGRLLLTHSLNEGRNEIPIQFYSSYGVYIVALEADNLSRLIKKLLLFGPE